MRDALVKIQSRTQHSIALSSLPLVYLIECRRYFFYAIRSDRDRFSRRSRAGAIIYRFRRRSSAVSSELVGLRARPSRVDMRVRRGGGSSSVLRCIFTLI